MLLNAFIWFSCCSKEIDSKEGLYFKEITGEKIVKIDLVGVNRTIYYNTNEANITLNPADTVSRFVVYFTNDTGTVEIAYQKDLSYVDGSCKENLVVVYKPRVSYTTFSSVQINNPVLGNEYVEITR